MEVSQCRHVHGVVRRYVNHLEKDAERSKGVEGVKKKKRTDWFVQMLKKTKSTVSCVGPDAATWPSSKEK